MDDVRLVNFRKGRQIQLDKAVHISSDIVGTSVQVLQNVLVKIDTVGTDLLVLLASEVVELAPRSGSSKSGVQPPMSMCFTQDFCLLQESDSVHFFNNLPRQRGRGGTTVLCSGKNSCANV